MLLPQGWERIEGERIYLRPLIEEDATERYSHWLNDAEVNKFLETRQASKEDLQKYIRQKRESEMVLFLGIFWKENDEHIGNVKLEPVDFNEKKATLGILIGEKEYWGRGVATEVTDLLTTFAFDHLGLQEVNLGVIRENSAAIRVYEKCGFEVYKVGPNALTHGDKKYDQIWMRKIKK